MGGRKTEEFAVFMKVHARSAIGVETLSIYDESELILQKGTRFRVLSRRFVQSAKKALYIELEEI